MVNMTCENHHGYGLVALQQQRQMSVVDDDQRLGFCCVAPPSCLKVYGGGGGGWWWPTRLKCQPQGPWVFELIGTWLGLGQGGLGTKGFGPGLDN